MKQIKLMIFKLTLVPTKRAILHAMRNDWQKVFKIEYEECESFFTGIDTDAKFAWWLKSQFGNGRYRVSAWKKGTKGVIPFIKLEILDHGFRRLPKTETAEQKEIRTAKNEINKLKRQIKNPDVGDNRKEMLKESLNSTISDLKEELDMKIEDVEFLKELEEISCGKRGPAPYLKTTMPIFHLHDYDKNCYLNLSTAPRKIKESSEESGGNFEDRW